MVASAQNVRHTCARDARGFSLNFKCVQDCTVLDSTCLTLHGENPEQLTDPSQARFSPAFGVAETAAVRLLAGGRGRGVLADLRGLRGLCGLRVAGVRALAPQLAVLLDLGVHGQDEHQRTGHRDEEAGQIEGQVVVAGDVGQPAGQRRTDQIGDALHEQQQSVGVGEAIERDQFDQDDAGERVVGGDEQAEQAGDDGEALRR